MACEQGFTFPQLVDEIRRILTDQDGVPLKPLFDVMNRYKSKEEEWKMYEMFDDHKYTRNLVDTGNDKYNLIVLCWNYGQGSTIHGHGDSQCIMKILKGEAKEEHFIKPSAEQGEHQMEPVATMTHKLNDVTHIADSQGKVHRVSNPSHTEQLVTLHLYFPPLVECDVFDEATSHKSLGRMSYWSKDGKKLCQ